MNLKVYNFIFISNLDNDSLFSTVSFLLSRNPKCECLFVIRNRRSMDSLEMYCNEWKLKMIRMNGVISDEYLYSMIRVSL